MTEQEDARRKSRRDLLLVLLILPLGVLCMFMTGQVAIRLAPDWVLNADMRSLLDPNAQFSAGGNQLYIEPLDPGILTLPAWGDLFLTPNATIPTRLIPTATPPPPARTPEPPPVRNTPVDDPDPTATVVGPIILPTHPGSVLADLAIELSDNSRTYTPGTPINYTILVSNLGPDNALRFDVIDNIPAAITGLTVNCTPAVLCGTNTSNGNAVSFTGANLPYSGGINQITISVSGTVASGATGDLSNTAEIVVPNNPRFGDPNLSNNIVTDTDRQRSVYDLAITKTDGVDTYTVTSPINYTIVVTNSGPSDALGITIRDNLPPQIASWTWTCRTVINASGCNGIIGSTTNFADTVNIVRTGRIEYSVTAYPSGLSQDISNTASIVIPSGPGFVDPDLSNNSATDVNIPLIDLQIAKTDGVNTYLPGGNLTYTVTVTNNSTFNLSGITVIDNIPPLISSWTWTCAPDPVAPGASCTPGPSNTNINDTAVNLPAGGAVTYTIDATINGTATGDLTNTASVILPAAYTDANPGNNTATDTDTYLATDPIPPQIGTTPDSIIYALPSGGVLTMNITTMVNGNPGPDLVYYEFAEQGEVFLDWIQVEVGNGINWYTVFYWGDEIADTNSNMDYNSLLPPLLSPLPPPNEPDERHIQSADLMLFPPTGIAIDLDGIAPPGTYPFLRITALQNDADGQLEIDAILTIP